MIPSFAKKRTGMRISLSGMLKAKNKFMLKEFEKHLELMGAEYYKGNTAIVDEILQLYCIAENEREEAWSKIGESSSEVKC